MRKSRRYLNIWSGLSTVFILFVILPNLTIVAGLFSKPNDTWVHIRTYLLRDYIVNSVTLVTWTGLVTVCMGLVCAWLVSLFEFPGRGFFKWALVLPLAVPPYMGSYTYHGIVNYTGIIQTTLRNRFAISVNQKYFDIMSMEGAVFIFSIFLFPYVYLIVQSFLEKQSASLIENAKLLGRNSLDIFFSVVVPVSRTAIVGGASLVILEVLNDYGVAQYFGIPTFSTAIFQTWFAMGDLSSSIRLSAILMLLIFTGLGAEKILRGRKQFSYSSAKYQPVVRQQLPHTKGYTAFLFCFIIFSLGFLIPFLQLLQWGLLTYSKVWGTDFINMTVNSLSVALVTSALIVVMAIVIANFSRTTNHWTASLYSRVTVIGYSIPGAIIAIGVIVLFVGLDRRLNWLLSKVTDTPGQLILSTSIIMLVFAYLVRFLAIGYNAVDSGFDKVGRKFFEASRMLGMNITKTFFYVDFPMIRPAMVSGFILVFVDILKELPLTLVLRPFNFHTLATKSFQYANDEMVHEAAWSSLIIIFISMVSVYLFYKFADREAG